MDNKELGNTGVCMEGYAWKGRKELDTPTDFTRRDTFKDIFARRENHQHLDEPNQTHHHPSATSFPLNQTSPQGPTQTLMV